MQRAVEVVAEIDGIHVDVGEQFLAHLGHAGFGVTHGCRAVAVHAAEIALTVDQRVAHREILRHAHERVVNGNIAVRVILAQHLADDARAFLVRRIGTHPQVVHRVENAAVNRLKSVARVGQRSRDDHAHGVIEIRFAHLLTNIHLPD